MQVGLLSLSTRFLLGNLPFRIFERTPSVLTQNYRGITQCLYCLVWAVNAVEFVIRI